jgi:hypothetical protein
MLDGFDEAITAIEVIGIQSDISMKYTLRSVIESLGGNRERKKRAEVASRDEFDDGRKELDREVWHDGGNKMQERFR